MAASKQPVIWAVNLSNQPGQSSWKRSGNKALVVYEWPGITMPDDSDIAAVAKAIRTAHPQYGAATIKRLAGAVYHYSRVSAGNRLVGYDGKNHDCWVGDVVHVERLPQGGVSIMVERLSNLPGEKILPLMDETADITPVELTAKGGGLFVSRGKTIDHVLHMLLKRDSIKGNAGEEKAATASPPEREEEGSTVTLHYGTNRQATGDSQFNKFYGFNSGALRLGVCKVSIPKGHKQGKVERPQLWKLQFKENPKKHVMIVGLEELDEAAFLSSFKKRLAEEESGKSALLFIHGFNNSFAEAARQAGQLLYDLPFKGPGCFFSWPSAGKPTQYFPDVERADSSRKALHQFITLLIEKTGIEQLHILAHSMGGRLLSHTLTDLWNDAALLSKLNMIHQVVLAAPDIDQEVFRENILPAFVNIGQRRTLYASDIDMALNISAKLRGGRLRLGDAGDIPFLANGMDTIDATNVHTSITEHSYIFEAEKLLDDLHDLLQNGNDPKGRRLKPRKGPNGEPYWLFAK